MSDAMLDTGEQQGGKKKTILLYILVGELDVSQKALGLLDGSATGEKKARCVG